MKIAEWTEKGVPGLFLLVVSLYAVFILGLVGCGDDDTGWSGTWILVTVAGQSVEQFFQSFGGVPELNFSVVANRWTFDSDGTMQGELGVKFQGRHQGAEVAGSISMTTTGTYFLSGFDYTLTTNVLMVGQEPTATGVEDFRDTFTDDEQTGTWSRTGDTLILNRDNGLQRVFVKI